MKWAIFEKPVPTIADINYSGSQEIAYQSVFAWNVVKHLRPSAVTHKSSAPKHVNISISANCTLDQTTQTGRRPKVSREGVKDRLSHVFVSEIRFARIVERINIFTCIISTAIPKIMPMIIWFYSVSHATHDDMKSLENLTLAHSSWLLVDRENF
jgi:hypothetical protein